MQAAEDNPNPSFHQYCAGGQLALWASRHWMRAYRRGHTMPPCVWQSFAHAGLAPAYEALCGLMTIIAFREFPPTGFARPGSAKVTEAEALLMQVMLDVERGFDDAAKHRLADSASPAVARAILGKMRHLIGHLNIEGHRIGHRVPDTGINAGEGPAFLPSVLVH